MRCVVVVPNEAERGEDGLLPGLAFDTEARAVQYGIEMGGQARVFTSAFPQVPDSPALRDLLAGPGWPCRVECPAVEG